MFDFYGSVNGKDYTDPVEFINALKNNSKEKEMENKIYTDAKRVGDYTLNEIKKLCPYAMGKLDSNEDMGEYCEQECVFGAVCGTFPDEWTEDKLAWDGKKHLTREEIADIKKQIAKLQERLNNGI